MNIRIIFLTSMLAMLVFNLINPSIGYASHDDINTIERMYNKRYKPINSDENAPIATSARKTVNGYVFTFKDSDYHHLILNTDIHDIINQRENGFLFRTYKKELPHIRVIGILDKKSSNNN